MASANGLGLEATPTYSVAITAFIFISISLVVERGIHRLSKYLKKKDQKPLKKVLDKLSEELMLLGFISLLLTVFQNSVVKICVSPDFSRHLLPCRAEENGSGHFAPAESPVSTNFGRKLLNLYLSAVEMGPRRQLMAESLGTGRCASKGKVPFVSVEVLHQLHIFIFALAITHVCYSLVTVLLGFARLHNWRHWEEETRERGYDGNLDLQRRYCQKVLCEKHPMGISGHANAFVDRRANHWCYENPISLWMLCFFQQFFASVSREDYLTFRVGFLNKHNLRDSFNFRDYVIRSMEMDFKGVIGISWWLWLIVVLFLLLNVHGWYTYFWMAFIPTILVLIIGTKQQHIISTLALQAKRHAAHILAKEAGANGPGKLKGVVDIAPAVSPSDQLFWFDNPKLLLRLLHFIIFQNSFELAVFFWLVAIFGWNSCILGNHALLIVRLIVGIATQLLCSYSTLPIYALVTQMGTQMKETVFTTDVFEGLLGWREKAKRTRARKSASNSEENSQQFSSEHGSNKGESTEDISTSPEGAGQQLERIATVPREGPHIRNNDQDPDPDPDPNLKRMCQLMYGKKDGLEKIKAAARIAPSSFRELKEEEEENQRQT